MTRIISTIADFPNTPAVYALIGGRGRGQHIAYVGVAGKLKNRIKQHLVRRDSSVVAGNAAARLDPDAVTEVLWWEHPEFEERPTLEAAEMVAFDVLDPALRSRGLPQGQVKDLVSEEAFVAEMKSVFEGEPTGSYRVISLDDALERISELESRVKILEDEVRMLSSR